jgi:hypothetical protein
MSETYTTKDGQKVTTYYKEAKSSEEKKEAHSDRAAQNRKIRDESGHAPVDPYPKSGKRPDRRENLPEEESEEQESKPRKKPAKKQHREPGVIDNIGRNTSRYIANNNGRPVWMGSPSGKKAKGNGMPPWMSGTYGGGKMPAWVMGGPAPWDPVKKASTPARARKVPVPKSTRPSWMRW